jgi:hypothetical protein
MSSRLLGSERKWRGVFEGDEWGNSLEAAGISPEVWDDRFLFAIENIAKQPLENTHPFLEHPYRLIQVSLPNELIGDVYFRIEADDNNCTLLWIEAKRIRRVG